MLRERAISWQLVTIRLVKRVLISVGIKLA
jgi:hypothetical protein